MDDAVNSCSTAWSRVQELLCTYVAILNHRNTVGENKESVLVTVTSKILNHMRYRLVPVHPGMAPPAVYCVTAWYRILLEGPGLSRLD